MTATGDAALGRAGRVAAGLLLSGVACAVQAAPWNVEPSVSAMATYQSNPQLYDDQNRSGSGELLTLALPVDWNDGATKFTVSPTVNAGEASGATGLGQHNKTLDVSWLHAFDRGSFRANGNVSRLDLFGASAVDFGIVRPTGYTLSKVAAVGMTWHPSERGVLDVDVSQSRFSYRVSQSGPVPYIDYRYTTVATQYSHSVSERTQLLATLTGGEYLPDTGGLASNDRSLQLGLSHQLTESLLFSGTFGRSQLSRDGVTARLSGNVYTASLTWSRVTDSAALTAKQFRQPGPFGNVTLETDLRATWTYHATERLSYSLSGAMTKLDDTYSTVTFARRDYFNADASVSYALSPQWRVDLHVSDVHAALPATVANPRSTSANSHGGQLSITRTFGRTQIS